LTEVGGFHLLGELRSGESGTWYAAEHRPTRRPALVKLMRPELTRPEAVTRFAEDIRTFALLAHPALARVYDAGVHTDGRVYVAIERVHGRTLRERLDAETTLSPEVAMAITRQVAHGLGAAHLAGLTHHDLQPADLVVDEPGTHACVLDFAVARLVADLPGRERNATYLAPEQIRGATNVDHRADVYALGCLCHEMLAGKPPHQDATAHQFAPAPSLPDAVPAGLRALVAAMLAKDPAERPQTMDHVVAELDKLGAAKGEVPPEALEQASAVRAGVGDPGRERLARKQASRQAGTRVALFVGMTGAALVIVVIGTLLARQVSAPVAAAAVSTCEQGDGAACFTSALRLGEPRARSARFERACELGYGPGCTAAGSLAEARGDAAHADAFYEAGCAAGDGQGCTHLGRRSERDAARAEAYFRRGCDLGAAPACTRLGERYSSVDPDVAAGYLTRGCDGNDGAACRRLADLYQAGRGVERDAGKAAMLAQRACALEASLCPKE
jgi:TPR repeat protein